MVKMYCENGDVVKMLSENGDKIRYELLKEIGNALDKDLSYIEIAEITTKNVEVPVVIGLERVKFKRALNENLWFFEKNEDFESCTLLISLLNRLK